MLWFQCKILTIVCNVDYLDVIRRTMTSSFIFILCGLVCFISYLFVYCCAFIAVWNQEMLVRTVLFVHREKFLTDLWRYVQTKVLPNGSFVINKKDPRSLWSLFLYSIISCGQPCPQGFSFALETSLSCAVN